MRGSVSRHQIQREGGLGARRRAQVKHAAPAARGPPLRHRISKLRRRLFDEVSSWNTSTLLSSWSTRTAVGSCRPKPPECASLVVQLDAVCALSKSLRTNTRPCMREHHVHVEMRRRPTEQGQQNRATRCGWGSSLCLDSTSTPPAPAPALALSHSPTTAKHPHLGTLMTSGWLVVVVVANARILRVAFNCGVKGRGT